MCRIFLSRENNHKVATATTINKRWLRQRGDFISVLEDGAFLGKVAGTHPRFLIIDLPGVPAKRVGRLFEGIKELSSREIRLSLTALREFLTTEQKRAVSNGKRITLTKEVFGLGLQDRETRQRIDIKTILRAG